MLKFIEPTYKSRKIFIMKEMLEFVKENNIHCVCQINHLYLKKLTIQKKYYLITYSFE